MAHTVKDRKKLQTRIRRIKGQVEALEVQLGADADCMKVLQQIAAIRGATNGLMMQVLEGHIREHLAPEQNHQGQKGEDLEQVITMLRSYLK